MLVSYGKVSYIATEHTRSALRITMFLRGLITKVTNICPGTRHIVVGLYEKAVSWVPHVEWRFATNMHSTMKLFMTVTQWDASTRVF